MHTSLAPFRVYATFLYLSLLFTGAQAMDNPNQRTDYDELKGIQVWNGLPYHDFRLIWLAALMAALGSIVQDGARPCDQTWSGWRVVLDGAKWVSGGGLHVKVSNNGGLASF